MSVEIESRAYGPDCTAAEREAIRDRIEVIDNRIVGLTELPVQTLFTVELLFDRVDEVSAALGPIGTLVDLTVARRPTAVVRAALKRRFLALRDRVVHGAFVVGGNVIMRAMVRLVALTLGYRSVSVHVTRAEALEELRRALAGG